MPVSSTWRSDLNSLSFQPDNHAGQCLIHRRAFQTILGFQPTPEQCAACYIELRHVFQQAAAVKIRRAALTSDARFHLTSRDVLRARKAPAAAN